MHYRPSPTDVDRGITPMYMLRFDLRSPERDAEQRRDLYRTALEMAAWADDNACMSLVVSEHHTSEDGYLPSPFTMAAAMAAVTQNTPIVIAAALLPLYEPVRLAEELITLDHLSAGRVMTVLGLGYRPAEYDLHGVSFDQRGKLADEKLAALLEALDAAAAGDASPRVTPPPFSEPRPMLAWGGGSKAAARRAGRFGVSFFAQGNADGLEETYLETARAHGHEPGMCFLPTGDAPLITFVNDDVDAGWDEVGPAMLADAVPYHDWNEAAGTTATTVSLSTGRTVEELRAERGAHQVVTSEQAAAIVAEHGSLSLHPLCGGLDPAVAWPYLRRAVAAVT